MTTATRSVAVVATRLPTQDRRALSQAWFSALHLTGAQAQPRAGTPFPAPDRRTDAAPKRSMRTPAAPPAVVAPAPTAGRTARRTEIVAPDADRRASATELSRRIERALVRHAAQPPESAVTIAIKADNGRVQLVVRSDRQATRIVALCAPELRESVDRALARARFALAASGTRIEAA